MSNATMGAVVRHLRDLAERRGAGGRTDRQLLHGFARQRDEGAFALLVRRHGAMVLGVCRRVLRQQQDAEDAFQAAFLVLARKAGSSGWGDSVGGWLFRVAYHLALKARRRGGRRRAVEVAMAQVPETAAAPAGNDPELRAALDEEVSRLPEGYRAAVVLCYLEGRDQAEAGRQLGCTVDALKGRLRRAREMLQRRLRQRGVGLSVAALGAVLAEGAASAAPSAALLASTARAAVLFAAGAQAAGAVSAQALALAVGGLKTMCVTKIKLFGIVLASVGMLAGGGVAMRGPGGAWTGAPSAAAAQPEGKRIAVAEFADTVDDLEVVLADTPKEPAGALSDGTAAELKKLLQSPDPEVRRSAAELLKRLRPPQVVKRPLGLVAVLKEPTAPEVWALVDAGKSGKIRLRPAGKQAKPGDVTRELVVYKKDGKWAAEEVLGTKLKLSRVINTKTTIHSLRTARLDGKDANAPQAKLADLEKKVRALSEELEALRRQMKQAPQKQ
jgi:RNA polymerase sigma factor (sigma-70 family)